MEMPQNLKNKNPNCFADEVAATALHTRDGGKQTDSGAVKLQTDAWTLTQPSEDSLRKWAGGIHYN